MNPEQPAGIAAAVNGRIGGRNPVLRAVYRARRGPARVVPLPAAVEVPDVELGVAAEVDNWEDAAEELPQAPAIDEVVGAVVPPVAPPPVVVVPAAQPAALPLVNVVNVGTDVRQDLPIWRDFRGIKDEVIEDAHEFVSMYFFCKQRNLINISCAMSRLSIYLKQKYEGINSTDISLVWQKVECVSRVETTNEINFRKAVVTDRSWIKINAFVEGQVQRTKFGWLWLFVRLMLSVAFISLFSYLPPLLFVVRVYTLGLQNLIIGSLFLICLVGVWFMVFAGWVKSVVGWFGGLIARNQGWVLPQLPAGLNLIPNPLMYILNYVWAKFVGISAVVRVFLLCVLFTIGLGTFVSMQYYVDSELVNSAELSRYAWALGGFSTWLHAPILKCLVWSVVLCDALVALWGVVMFWAMALGMFVVRRCLLYVLPGLDDVRGVCRYCVQELRPYFTPYLEVGFPVGK
jgi:hypothetical protein